ncbi:MAG: cytochrome ubiquinol oxidase subunit I, partial [Myxococcota bacterium]
TLTSIIMFGLIYMLLGALWVFVMNTKIQHGPEDPKPLDHEDSGFLEAARELRDPGFSLTDAQQGSR